MKVIRSNRFVSNAFYKRINEQLRAQLDYATRGKHNRELRQRISSGNYSYDELDDEKNIQAIGFIHARDGEEIATRGSTRYGNCMAVPDERGYVFLIFLGMPSGSYEHSIVASLMPEEAEDRDLIVSELQRMWTHRNIELRDASEFVPATLVKNDGPGVDLTKNEARDIVGRISRWFETKMDVSDRAAIGDIMETRLKQGADKGKRLRIEAVETGFMAFVSATKLSADEEADEWHTLWLAPTLKECLEFATANKSERDEYVSELVDMARSFNGTLRYINGSLHGAVHTSEGFFVVKDWIVYQMDDSENRLGVFVNFSLEIRDILAIG